MIQIQIYSPAGDKNGCPVSDQPPSLPPDSKGSKHFTFDSLPDKYWKRYQYATRFVKLVRSKTPKVTLYTPQAKAMLMENSPQTDFEVTFFDGKIFTLTCYCGPKAILLLCCSYSKYMSVFCILNLWLIQVPSSARAVTAPGLSCEMGPP